jgi:superfamily I DNA/RNA helicase
VENEDGFYNQYQNRFKYIFVDEYQDINQAQFRLIKKMSESHHNICVIGDPKQSIYGFRGSSAQFFPKFLSAFPGTTIISLTQNYRSTQAIVEASSQVIDKGLSFKNSLKPSLNFIKSDYFEPRLYSNTKGEKAIGILETATGRAEAVAVGKTIEKLIGGIGFHYMDFGDYEAKESKTHRSFSDFAVLYRTTKQNEVLGEVFNKAGLPFHIASRENYLFKRGISEIVSLMRIIEDAASVADLERIKNIKKLGLMKKSLEVLKTGLYKHKTTVTDILAKAERFPFHGLNTSSRLRLFQFLRNIENLKAAAKGMSVYQKLLYLGRYTQSDTAMASDPNIDTAFKKLLSLAQKYDGWPLEFLAGVSLQSDTDMVSPDSEKVSLMTMHASKGLEFPVVFIVGCEKDLIPLQRRGDEDCDIDEERRLFYVAMTRAKEMLFLSYAQKRKLFGRTAKRRISPFVEEIQASLKRFETSDFKQRGKKNQRQLELF